MNNHFSVLKHSETDSWKLFSKYQKNKNNQLKSVEYNIMKYENLRKI